MKRNLLLLLAIVLFNIVFRILNSAYIQKNQTEKMKTNSFWNNTMIYGLGFLLLRGISFFLLPIYTNLLSAHEAGIIFLIYTLLAFLNPVYAYGMNASLFKFYNNDKYLGLNANKSEIYSIIKFLKDKEHLLFNQLIDITAIDYPSRDLRFDIIYILISLTLNQRIILKSPLNENDNLDSISPIHQKNL